MYKGSEVPALGWGRWSILLFSVGCNVNPAILAFQGNGDSAQKLVRSWLQNLTLVRSCLATSRFTYTEFIRYWRDVTVISNLSYDLGPFNVIKPNRGNGQNYKNTRIVIIWNYPWSLHEQPEDKIMHCNVTVRSTCRALMVLMFLSVHILWHWLSSGRLQVTASRCWSDLLPVTVLVSLEAGMNFALCVVVSHPSCIVFALCDVLVGQQEDVCNDACSVSISLEFGHSVWQSVSYVHS